MSSRFLPLTVSFVLALSTPAGIAQTKLVHRSRPLAEASPRQAGTSSERLARIDSMCEGAVRNGQVPGVVALVARHGKIVYHKAFGMADNAANRKLAPDDIFRIASQSKAITATAVMILWEEGRFQLDDPILKWFPELKETGVLKTFNETDGTWTTDPVKSPITFRHLLTHTSGIGYGVIDGDDRFKKIYAKAGVTDLLWTGVRGVEGEGAGAWRVR